MSIDLTGLERKMRDGANRGLLLASEHLLGAARALTPIEESTLEKSGKATQDPDELTAAVSFNTPYAVKQHEDLSLRHDAGRTAKYLETPMNTEVAAIGQLVATAIRNELGT